MPPEIDLDKTWVYRFIRTDLPVEQHIVQNGHSSWHAGLEFGISLQTAAVPSGIPYNITIGVANVAELKEVAAKLTEAGIRWTLFSDTDVDADPTALVTFPVDKKTRKKCFLNHGLKLYSPRVESYTSVAGFNAERGASAGVAQLREHAVSNGVLS